MNKKIPVSLVVAIILVAMTVTFSMTMIISQRLFNQNMSSIQEKSAMYDKLAKLDIATRNNFYGNINDEALLDTMAAGYVAGLGDKENKYYTKAQYTELLNRQAGKLLGLGFNLVKDAASGYAKIINVYNDSPAFENGIVKGDMIIKIGDIDVRNLTVEQINTLVQGTEGTAVDVTYIVSATAEEKVTALVHRAYAVPSVTSQIVDFNGYIKISDFNDNTPVEFDTQVQSLISNGAKSLILDVRDNQSTNLESVYRVLDILVGSGILVSGEYRDVGKETTVIKTLYSSDAREINMPMVVVMNENTAYGAELFAADLQEYDKAKLVGTKTAGKGSIQEIFVQPDGSAIQITVAKMLTSKNSNFSGVGLEPNFGSELSDQQKQTAYDLTVQNDPQILRAIEVANNIIKGVVNAEPSPLPEITPSVEEPQQDSSEQTAE